jgi:hypothetical protein
MKELAVAAVLGVMRSVSTPLGITHPDKPNLASTLWRTVYDQKNKIFYFDSAAQMPSGFPLPMWISQKALRSKSSPCGREGLRRECGKQI